MSARIIKIEGNESLWYALQNAGAPPSNGFPYLLSGNKAYNSADSILQSLPEIFGEANAGQVQPFQPVFPLHRRIVVALFLALIVWCCLAVIRPVAAPEAVGWIAAIIAGIALWLTQGQCLQCGDAAYKKWIAGIGAVVYLYILFAQGSPLAIKLATWGSRIGALLLAVQLTGIVPICPACLVVDVLAIVLGLISQQKREVAEQKISFGPQLSSRAKMVGAAVIVLLASGYFVAANAPAPVAEMSTIAVTSHVAPPRSGMAPPATLDVSDASGNKLDLNAYRGKWTVVVWGSPTCQPCSALAQELSQIQNLSVVHVWFDKGWAVPSPGWFGEEGHETAQRFGADSAATFNVIDPQGRVALTVGGYPNTGVKKIIDALRSNAPVQRFLTGYDTYLVAAGKVEDKSERSTVQVYLPRFDDEAKQRLEWLSNKYPSYRLVIWCSDPKAASFHSPHAQLQRASMQYLGRFSMPPKRPHTYIVDAAGKIVIFEQAAEPFPFSASGGGI